MIDNVVESVHRLLMDHLPVKTRRTPSGWITMDCPMCNDKRKRGGIIVSGPKISYHCFNCDYKTGWAMNTHLSKKYRNLSERLGASESEIHAAQVLLLKHGNEIQDVYDSDRVYSYSKFETQDLPEDSVLIQDLPDDHELKIYAAQRGILGLYPLLHFDSLAFKRRIIIPYTYNGELVGWTGRHISPPDKNTPKYLSSQPPGYVFNIDRFANEQRDIVVVVEGIIDAILLDSVAVLSNNITPEQAHLIEKLNKRVIVCPDRDQAGKDLIDQAVALGWSVSFPDWSNDIKDAADACAKYGRLATLHSIIKNATDNKIKIQVQSKML